MLNCNVKCHMILLFLTKSIGILAIKKSSLVLEVGYRFFLMAVYALVKLVILTLEFIRVKFSLMVETRHAVQDLMSSVSINWILATSCFCINWHNCVFASIYIYIFFKCFCFFFSELPHPPNNVQATLQNSHPKKVNVSWSKAFDGNSPVTNYIVQMRVVPNTGTMLTMFHTFDDDFIFFFLINKLYYFYLYI